jgi:hypothetical protein
MPRRAAFSSQPTDTIAMIPVAKNKQTRDWEKSNRARSYYIPRHLEDRAVVLRDEIVGIADGLSQSAVWATATDVAVAFMERALFKVEKSAIVLDARLDPAHKKTGLICVDVEGEFIPQIITQKEKNTTRKKFFLAYRWPNEFDKKIKTIAKHHHLLTGEVVVLLFSAALDAYKNGNLRLIPQSITVRQTVAGAWK